MSKLAMWISVSRPKTLIAGISPVCIGTAIGYHHGFFSLLTFLCALITGICIQIGTNLANDYFDFKKGADDAERLGPQRALQTGLISKKTLCAGIVLSFLLASLSCSYLIKIGGTPITVLLLLAILLGVGYTAGPFSLAYLGLGDLFVTAFFGVVATMMTTYLMSHKIYLDSVLAGLAPGFLSTALLTINNLRDRITDQRANKKTLPVRFGEMFGKLEYCFMILFAHIIPLFLFYYFNYPLEILFTVAAIIPSIPLIKKVLFIKSPTAYIDLFPKTSIILFLFTLFFCFSLICSHLCL